MLGTVVDGIASAVALLGDGYARVLGDLGWIAAILTLALSIQLALLPISALSDRFAVLLNEMKDALDGIKRRRRANRRRLFVDFRGFRAVRKELATEEEAVFAGHGVNPLIGLVPLMVQIPIWILVLRSLSARDTSRGNGHTSAESAFQSPLHDGGRVPWLWLILTGIAIVMIVTRLIENATPTSAVWPAALVLVLGANAPLTSLVFVATAVMFALVRRLLISRRPVARRQRHLYSTERRT